jgi:hypothetical protein
MKRVFIVGSALIVFALSCQAEVPKRTFVTGNIVYEWCKRDRATIVGYTIGIYESAAFSAVVIDGMRQVPERPGSNNAVVDFAIERVAAYCMPEGATPDQITDLFCAYLKETPAERHGLPAILFNRALKKAWPCKR